jgi:proteasome lid subunit RPN8/RPN11
VVIPAAVRGEIARHADEEAPNESCGLLLLRDDVAERYERGINAAASPYRFDLQMTDPEIWFAEDEGLELAVVHSHVSSPPRPSRTDVQNIGLWKGKPYVIYTLRTDELGAWRILDDGIEQLPVRSSERSEDETQA